MSINLSNGSLLFYCYIELNLFNFFRVRVKLVIYSLIILLSGTPSSSYCWIPPEAKKKTYTNVHYIELHAGHLMAAAWRVNFYSGCSLHHKMRSFELAMAGTKYVNKCKTHNLYLSDQCQTDGSAHLGILPALQMSSPLRSAGQIRMKRNMSVSLNTHKKN